MKKYYYYSIIFFIFLLILIISCNQNKINEFEVTIDRLNSRIAFLESGNRNLRDENDSLKEEIFALKETDQYYYQTGAEEFNNGNFDVAIDWMNRLKLKFPASTLTQEADRIIRNANAEITAIYERERTYLNQILREARTIDIEDAIRNLETYIRGNHPADLIETARNTLNQYNIEFESIRAEREVERINGVRLTDYFTGWNEYTSYGQTLFQPNVALRFTNITNQTLPTKTVGSFGIETTNTIEIKVDFVDIAKNEIFGTGTSYLVGYTENLPAGMSRTAYIRSSVGYTSSFSVYELEYLPALEARIYINNRFYKTLNVRKAYRTGG